MLTGELRSKIDGVWNAFWAGGIANPLEVIEQITYLLFMRGLDDAHTLEERRVTRFGKPMEIAEAVLWLSSDKSSFMTGHYITLDGGMLVGPNPNA